MRATLAILGLLIAPFVAIPGNAEAPPSPTAGSVPRGFQSDGNLRKWQETEPALSLARGNFRNAGQIWIASSNSGLVVAGQVVTDDARFEITSERIRLGDHLVIQLRLARELALPPIGWGNQWGYRDLSTADVCAEVYPSDVTDRLEHLRSCRAWHAVQQAHRERLDRLFTRRWVMVPHSWQGLVLEDEASVAFSGIDLEGRELFEPLAPRGRPTIRTLRTESGYSFEVTIPWDAMPPSATLDLEHVSLIVEAHTGHESSIDTEITSKATDVRLDPVRNYHVGPCHAPLEGFDRHNHRAPAYFLPTTGLELEKTFVLANEATAYRDYPGGRSPGLFETEHTSAESRSGDLVCGPLLGIVHENQWVEARRQKNGSLVFITEPFSARRINDELLLKVGPRSFQSRFGSGECGGCPRVDAYIYRIEDDGNAEAIFSYWTAIRPPMNVDVHVSDDWERIDVFEYRGTSRDPEPRWHKKTWCREGPAYEICGEESPAPAPAHRVVFIEHEVGS